MKSTCLSEGGGFHFPPCHLINICGFRVLFDCPANLSALEIFSPISTGSYRNVDEAAIPSLNTTGDQKRRKFEKALDADSLIKSEPYYRSIEKLHLWNASLIDIVLISSPMGMLGLPFLTRAKDFSAKIYATAATAKIGQLMMEDLVSMHAEFRHFYGPEFGFPRGMEWGELEALPLALKVVALGEDGSKLGGLMPLYSAADVKQCLEKVHTVRYAEEACYNGTLIIKAFSSGLEIGSCNWSLKGPKENIAYLSSSVLGSAIAMDFDFNALQGCDMVIYADFSSQSDANYIEDDNSVSTWAINDFPAISDGGNSCEVSVESLLNTDERTEEVEKLDFICSCVAESVKLGGSVLIPIGRLGIILQLLEQISSSLESSSLKVPVFIISSVAEELLAFSNIRPEWLCKHRQDKLSSGESMFAHAELIKEKRLHLFPAVLSVELLAMWQEPCIVICPHWSLRLGPAVHLLRRWCGDQNSLLVIEGGVDADLALLPFKPMAMKVLQCSFISGIKLEKIQPLLKILQPKLALLPKYLRRHIASLRNKMSCIHYTEGETLRIPKLKDFSELCMAKEFDCQLSWMKLEHEDMHVVARLKGELLVDKGMHVLLPGNKQVVSSQGRMKLEHEDMHVVARSKGELLVDKGMHGLLPGNKQVVFSQGRSLLFWEKLDLHHLLAALQKMGINGTVEQAMGDDESENASSLHIFEPNEAIIEVKATTTVISTADENLATLICEAITSMSVTEYKFRIT